jgi:adenine phosphoribosyltransferase
MSSPGTASLAHLTALIRDVPDFPKPGIIFKDITPLLGDAKALTECIALLAQPYRGQGITKVVGIESRGFILAPGVAMAIGAGFVPVRKPGKLPWKALKESYGLEYGKDTIEIHDDSLTAADRVLIVDDVLATGGTAAAAVTLVGRLGARVTACAFLIDLSFLGGAAKLSCPISSVLRY